MRDEPREWPVTGLFAGRPRTFGDGDRSAIVKAPVLASAWLDAGGLGGDEQADRVHHGGSDRALSHYPADHLPYWQAQLPAQAETFVPGAFGENLMCDGLTETQVCIGDVFQLGSAVVQVTQPRQPCWKVNQRFGIETLSRRMVDTRRCGWLYRVLEPGWVAPADSLHLAESDRDGITLHALWDLTLAEAPELDTLEAVSAHPALAEAWRLRLRTRGQWLRRRRDGQ